MAILTEDMKRVVEEQSLGFVATVSPDGVVTAVAPGTTSITVVAQVDGMRREGSLDLTVSAP